MLRKWPVWLLSPLLAVLVAGSANTNAEPADGEFLRWNVPADKADCPVGDTAVWSNYRGGRDCIRYFSAGEIENAPEAMVVFYGDRGLWAERELSKIPRNTVREQRAYVAGLSARFGMPVILIARPGTFGSSGNHYRRRQVAEFLALDAALDEIREQHRIGRFILVGQSGGATAVGALLTLGRADVSCAVMTSGAFALVERAEFIRKRNGRRSWPGRDTTGLRDSYDPLAHVTGIATDPARQILVIGSPEDRSTPFQFQKRFADAIAARGHNVRLVEHEAPPPTHHALAGVGLEFASRCAANGNHGGASGAGPPTRSSPKSAPSSPQSPLEHHLSGSTK